MIDWNVVGFVLLVYLVACQWVLFVAHTAGLAWRRYLRR